MSRECPPCGGSCSWKNSSLSSLRQRFICVEHCVVCPCGYEHGTPASPVCDVCGRVPLAGPTGPSSRLVAPPRAINANYNVTTGSAWDALTSSVMLLFLSRKILWIRTAQFDHFAIVTPLTTDGRVSCEYGQVGDACMCG